MVRQAHHGQAHHGQVDTLWSGRHTMVRHTMVRQMPLQQLSQWRRMCVLPCLLLWLGNLLLRGGCSWGWVQWHSHRHNRTHSRSLSRMRRHSCSLQHKCDSIHLSALPCWLSPWDHNIGGRAASPKNSLCSCKYRRWNHGWTPSATPHHSPQCTRSLSRHVPPVNLPPYLPPSFCVLLSWLLSSLKMSWTTRLWLASVCCLLRVCRARCFSCL